MSPQSNNMYVSVYRQGKSKRVSSPGLIKFKKYCERWHLINRKTIGKASEFFKARIEEGHKIHFNREFLFNTKSLYRLDGNPKRMDLTNRIKAIDDAVCNMLDIDDKFIWQGKERKVEIKNGLPECIIITITIVKSKGIEITRDPGARMVY